MIVKSDYDWTNLVTPKKLGARPGEPIVTIAERGAIVMNKHFVRKAKKQLEGTSHCILHYNPKKPHALIFEFTTETRPPARKMTGKRRANISLAARGFFNDPDVGVDLEDVVGKYTPRIAKIPRKGNCWYLDLDQKKTGD